MIRISPFTAVFFSPSGDGYQSDSAHVQTWKTTDRIVFEVISTEMSDSVPLNITLNSYDERMVKTTSMRSFTVWQMNSTTRILYLVFQNLAEGLYSVTFNGAESDLFRVTNDAKQLDGTSLITYYSETNRNRNDVVFVVNGTQLQFQVRVPGGFKDDGWQFGVDNEQFTDDGYETYDVFAHESEQRYFTLGNSRGVQPWFAGLLNRALTCEWFLVDGERYVRSESSVPEQTVMIEGLKSFVYKQLMRRTRD